MCQYPNKYSFLVCDTNKTNECAEKEISNTCYTTPNKNESCSCGFEPECGVNMRCTGSNDNIAAPNDWNAKCKGKFIYVYTYTCGTYLFEIRHELSYTTY